MLCPNCHHRNPDENRFCGNCGRDLTKSASTIYPREGYDEADLPPVSDVESNVPQFRRDVPPLPASEYAPPPEPERPVFREVIPEREVVPEKKVPRETREETRAERDEVRQETRQDDLRSYGSSTGILFNLDPRKSTPLVESSEPVRRISEPVRSEPVRSEPVHQFSDVESRPVEPRRSEGIHGPSFLGLADSADPDFLDDIDDEPGSRSRLPWLLLALLIVGVLAAAQWRNIRDTGLNFAGSMKLNLPHKGEAAKAPSGATTDTHSENGPANNGKPEIVVDPTNKTADQQSAQNNAQPSSGSNTNGTQQGTAATATPAATGGVEQQGASAAKSDGNAKPAEQQPTQQAKNNPPDTGKNAAADDNSGDDTDAADAEPAAKAPSRTAKAKAKAPAPTPKPDASGAGAEELARANSAGSPETTAKWLWASTSKGNLDAPVRLADMYATGRGVPKDCEQANVLLRSSARRGNPRASARLGMYYATGQCVQQDRSQAWHWLSLAHQRDPNSDWITQYRQRLWSEMSPEERARAGNGPTANASE